MTLSATFETEKASQYLQTLCKHFGRKVGVRFDAQSAEIAFPFGACTLRADEAGLHMTAQGVDADKAAEVLTSHLDRFAFRENPNIRWHSAKADH